jgi:hypothetical protein
MQLDGSIGLSRVDCIDTGDEVNQPRTNVATVRSSSSNDFNALL